jgi:hypothetical protein
VAHNRRLVDAEVVEDGGQIVGVGGHPRRAADGAAPCPSPQVGRDQRDAGPESGGEGLEGQAVGRHAVDRQYHFGAVAPLAYAKTTAGYWDLETLVLDAFEGTCRVP